MQVTVADAKLSIVSKATNFFFLVNYRSPFFMRASILHLEM